MAHLIFNVWRERLIEYLSAVELERDLGQGQILLITNTTEEDLRELHMYGWKVSETAYAMIEKVNLR